jgi:arginine-tRNA-protein transferase
MHRSAKRPQFFYTTAALPCPYVPGRTERKLVTELGGPDAEAQHDRLSRAGFRRSHNIAYAPVCPGCQSCVPIRILADRFAPNRTQRKIERINADLTAQEKPARATAEQFALFQRYQQARHGDGDMAAMGFYDYRAMVEDTPITTALVEFREPSGRLLACCLTDWLSDGLSAVYSFYDPSQPRRSLGTAAILWLVRRAQLAGMPYVYLGYWVPESRKMAYKARFTPSEVLSGGVWRAVDEYAAAGGCAALVPESVG